MFAIQVTRGELCSQSNLQNWLQVFIHRLASDAEVRGHCEYSGKEEEGKGKETCDGFTSALIRLHSVLLTI